LAIAHILKPEAVVVVFFGRTAEAEDIACENIKKYIDERLPEEYEKCLVGLTAILKEAWITTQSTAEICIIWYYDITYLTLKLV
jgi:hypothetical protein